MGVKTEEWYKKGILLHAVTFPPFLVCFSTNSWGVYRSEDGVNFQYGLWNICRRNSSLPAADYPEVCEAHNIHDLSGYFHAARTMFCFVLVTYVIGFFTKYSFTCMANDNKVVRENLTVQIPIFVLLQIGMTLFLLAREDYDEQNGVTSDFGFSIIILWVVSAMDICAAVLTSLPLWENCRKRNKMCRCIKNRGRSGSNTVASTAPAATATTMATETTATRTTRSVATSTTCPDLSTVEVPAPPTYSPGPDFNAWFELYVDRNQPGNTNPSSNSNAVGQRESNGEDQNPNSARSSPGGIFTVRVNPAPIPTSIEQSLPTPHEREPSNPPPRYEDIVTDSIPQSMELFRAPSAPPPSYENITSCGVTVLEPAQLTVVCRGSSPIPPPSQSDA